MNVNTVEMICYIILFKFYVWIEDTTFLYIVYILYTMQDLPENHKKYDTLAIEPRFSDWDVRL
jgi:hypothetical protein